MTIIIGLFFLASGQSAASVDPDPKNKTGMFEVANDSSCIAGHNPFSAGTTKRIHDLAESTIKNYLVIAGGSETADIRSVYTTKKSAFHWDGRLTGKKIKAEWSNNGTQGDINFINDPIAQKLSSSGSNVEKLLVTENFLVGGAKVGALGLWRVNSPTDQNTPIGWYRAEFMRENSLGSQAWMLMSLQLTTGSVKPDDVKQFCFEPGDVEKNRAEQEAKKAEKMRKKAARESQNN